MKKKSTQLKKRNEFRFKAVNVKTPIGRIKKIKHPAYVFYEKGNLYIYVTITHSSAVNDYLVIKLQKNPNPNDNKDAYVVLDVRTDIKSSFGARHKDWKISSFDEQMIRNFEKKNR